MAAESTSPPSGLGGHRLAVLVGIDAYGNGIPPLRNAVRDVQALAQILGSEHDYQTRLLLDEQASLTGLRSLLAELPRVLQPDSRLIFYFAGHGIAEETEDSATGPQGFLIPQDARSDVQATFLAMTELQAGLAKLPCRHLLLLLDCCFAGAFRWSRTRSLGVRRQTLYRERYERYLRDPAWQVITSASADERALDTVAGGKLGRRAEDTENSPFAAALCSALRGGADLRLDGQPGDGVILASELHVYLEAQFERLEQKLRRPLQKPHLWSLEGREKGQFFFFSPGRSPSLPSALALNEQNNPYRGLLPYDAKDAALFFGRDAVIEALQKQVQAHRLTVVSGLSGSGKSSLVRAGLLPRCSRQGEWQILPILRPGQQPLVELASLIRSLGAPEGSTLSAACRIFPTSTPPGRRLLVVDQLEELVTLASAATDRQAFLQQILDAVSASAGGLHVVFTLRSDFEPHFATLFATLSATLGGPQPGATGRFLVPPLSRQELRLIIEGPAAERVLYFDPPTLVDRLIDEVAEMPGALPLLSFTLSELYRSYLRSGRDDRSLSGEDYTALGGVGGALSQRAEALYAALDAAHAATLRRLMLRMVSLQGGEVARRRVPLSELDYGSGHAEQGRIDTLLKQLQEARLVVAGRDGKGTAYVEPAHDKLVLGWPRLWSALQDEQELIPLVRLLSQEAALWDQQGRSDDHLWTENPRLALACSQLSEQPLRWNARETAFIQKSEARRVQRLDDAVDVAEQIVALAETGLKRIAGATQIRAELMDLCQRLLANLGPSSQGHRGARRTEAWTLIQRADLRWASNEPDHLAQARALYEQALAIDERQLQENPDDPKARLDLTGTLHKVAMVTAQMGQLTQARAYLDRALQIGEAVVATAASLEPEMAVHSQRQLGLTLDRLAALSTQIGSLAEAHAFAIRGLGICEQLAQRHPADRLAQHDLLIATRRLGEVIEDQNGLPQAQTMYQRSLDLARALSAANPTHADLKRDISISLGVLGDVAEKMGQLSDAMRYFEQAQQITEDLAAADPSDGQALRDRAIGLKKLGQVASQLGDLDVARAHIELALEISEAQAAADPADAQAQRDLAIALSLLGDIDLQLDQAAQAKPRFQRALQIVEARSAENPADTQARRDLVMLLDKLGQVTRRLDKLGEADAFFRRALTLSEALAAADPADARAQRDLSLALNALGDAADAQEQLSRAKALYLRSLRISETLAAADPSNALMQHDLTSTLQRLASIAAAEGRDDEAEDLFRRALTILEDLAGLESDSAERQHEFLQTQLELAEFLHARDQRPAAQKIARAAAAVLGRVRRQLSEADADELDDKLRRLLPRGEGSHRPRR